MKKTDFKSRYNLEFIQINNVDHLQKIHGLTARIEIIDRSAVRFNILTDDFDIFLQKAVTVLVFSLMFYEGY